MKKKNNFLGEPLDEFSSKVLNNFIRPKACLKVQMLVESFKGSFLWSAHPDWSNDSLNYPFWVDFRTTITVSENPLFIKKKFIRATKIVIC